VDILKHIYANDDDFKNWFCKDFLSVRNRGGRPSTFEQVSEALEKMRAEGCNMALPHKRLAEEAAKRSGKELGKRNWNERTITRHVGKWLRDNGLA
jgi:hypothetical protein